MKGGYIRPDEIEKASTLINESFPQRMTRAANVFYDSVLNYQPELLSPAHNAFYNAAMSSVEANKAKTEDDPDQYLKEHKNQIDLASLGKTLVGLKNQALLYSRDVVRKDYLHKFYEDHLMIDEKLNLIPILNEKDKHEYVYMERAYLKAWKVYKEESAKLLP